MTRNKSRTKGYAIAIILLVTLAFFAYWYNYYYMHPTVTTTISTSTPSAINTTVQSLKGTDFNLATSNGCMFTNQTTGQTELFFFLIVTNRFNTPVHYVNEAVSGYLITNNFQNVSAVPFTISYPSSKYTNRLVILLTIPIVNIPSGTFAISVTFTANAQEVNGPPIFLMSQIPLSQGYSACST